MKLLKKNSAFILSCLLFTSFSCSSEKVTNPVQTNTIKNVQNKFTQTKSGADITVNVVLKNKMSTKSASGQKAKTIEDIKSFDIFLTSNFNNPLATGSNPLGDNVVLRVNASNQGSLNVTFNNIPVGGPYYAVIAAYDGVIDSNIRNNITESDLTITSDNNKFSRSENSVKVNANLSVAISDNKTSLNIPNLQLQNSKSVVLDSSITLNDLPMPGLGVSP